MLCVPSCEAFGCQGAEGAAPVAAVIGEVGKHSSCRSTSPSNSILSAAGEGAVPLQCGRVLRAEGSIGVVVDFGIRNKDEVVGLHCRCRKPHNLWLI
jgi:hypothetical protein